MLKYLWAFLLAGGLLLAVFTGKGESIVQAAIEGGSNAVTLCIALIGAYALWLGILEIAEKAGLTKAMAKRMKKLIARLFPELAGDDKSISLVSMNLACNMLGMGNAATPVGLQAMENMQLNNRDKSRATNAMCLLLVINASSIQLIPTTIISIRAATGSAAPAEIVGTALFATCVSTAVGIIAAKLLERKGG